MVVQSWEKDMYPYDCKYLIHPDNRDYHYSNHLCVANTRLFIYQTARNSKYALLDDDLQFKRRNQKYITGISNMERSSRICTDEDILEMFKLYDKWLDNPDVTVAGCSLSENPPTPAFYRNNASLSSAFWINGKHFSDELDSWTLNDVAVAKDVKFLLTLLTNGYGNRVSQEFTIFNSSAHVKNMSSSVWDNKNHTVVHTSHKNLARSFPGLYIVLYDEQGNRITGGYRSFGKTKTKWSKSFNKMRHELIVRPRLQHMLQ